MGSPPSISVWREDAVDRRLGMRESKYCQILAGGLFQLRQRMLGAEKRSFSEFSVGSVFPRVVTIRN